VVVHSYHNNVVPSCPRIKNKTLKINNTKAKKSETLPKKENNLKQKRDWRNGSSGGVQSSEFKPQY
jgi:hypothetical protein